MKKTKHNLAAAISYAFSKKTYGSLKSVKIHGGGIQGSHVTPFFPDRRVKYFNLQHFDPDKTNRAATFLSSWLELAVWLYWSFVGKSKFVLCRSHQRLPLTRWLATAFSLHLFLSFFFFVNLPSLVCVCVSACVVEATLQVLITTSLPLAIGLGAPWHLPSLWHCIQHRLASSLANYQSSAVDLPLSSSAVWKPVICLLPKVQRAG